MSTKTIFGGVIATILLGLYVYAVVVAISIVHCVTQTGCVELTTESFTDGMVSALTLIGGLVSALVIAELAITKPGEPPLARVVAGNPATRSDRAVKIVTYLYLSVWTGAGLSALVVGYIQHPNVLQPLTDLGQSWLGLAVAAAYSYFGIDP